MEVLGGVRRCEDALLTSDERIEAARADEFPMCDFNVSQGRNIFFK